MKNKAEAIIYLLEDQFRIDSILALESHVLTRLSLEVLAVYTLHLERCGDACPVML